MIDRLTLFWDFFFYPLTLIDGLDMVSDVLLMCVVCLAVFHFCFQVVDWSMNLHD